jgi:hypothetical protein
MKKQSMEQNLFHMKIHTENMTWEHVVKVVYKGKEVINL